MRLETQLQQNNVTRKYTEMQKYKIRAAAWWFMYTHLLTYLLTYLPSTHAKLRNFFAIFVYVCIWRRD